MVLPQSHWRLCQTQPVTDHQAQRRGGRRQASRRGDEYQRLRRQAVRRQLRMTRCWWLLQRRQDVLDQGAIKRCCSRRCARQAWLVDPRRWQRASASTQSRPSREFEEVSSVFKATARGTVKKRPAGSILGDRGRPASSPSNWMRAIAWWASTSLDGNKQVIRATAARPFALPRASVRPMGRTAGGVAEVFAAGEGEEVISSITLDADGMVLTASRTVTASSPRSRTSCAWPWWPGRDRPADCWRPQLAAWWARMDQADRRGHHQFQRHTGAYAGAGHFCAGAQYSGGSLDPP